MIERIFQVWRLINMWTLINFNVYIYIYFNIYGFINGQSLAIIPTKKINMTIYFENLTVGLNVCYVFTMHIKFCANRILFTI